MIGLIFVFVLIGIGIIWAVNRNTAVLEKEAELKRLELISNPNYQKYEERKFNQELINSDKEEVHKAYLELEEAEKSGDKDRIKRAKEEHEFSKQSLIQTRKEIQIIS